MRLFVLLAMSMCAAFVLPGAAMAQRCVAPPGTSAIEQYCETVPSDRGDRPTDQRGGSPAPLPPRAAEQIGERLAARGADGRAVAQLIGATSPAAQRQRPPAGKAAAGRSRQPATPVPGGAAASEPKHNPLNAVQSVVSSGGIGLGGTFGALLIVIAVGLVGSAYLGARRRQKPN